MAEQAISLCSWKDCKNPATHIYRWDWGEEGKVCASCIPLLQQTGVNLSRTVATRPLETFVEPPLQRSERTQLIAAKLSAEAELEEVQKRGHQLYQSNVDLTAQVQTHVMRAREHASIVAEKDAQIDRLSEDLEKRERELAEATTELQRLRVLAQFATETPRSGTERGLTSPEG